MIERSDQPQSNSTEKKVNTEEEENNDNGKENTQLTRSSRQRKITQRMSESIEQGHMTVFEANFGDDNEELISQKLNDPIAYLSRTQKDTMYCHEALKQPDRDKFIQAMVDEFDGHDERRH